MNSKPLQHSRVARVVALSDGNCRKDACHRLAANHGMIASFSRGGPGVSRRLSTEY